MYVLPFDHPDATELSQTGGKGANLARMAQAGFDVPPGFIVATDAYTTFVVASGLQERIEADLSGVDNGDFRQLELVTEGLRDAIIRTPVPGEIAAAIVEHCANPGEVAVRSSGTAEDLPGASFAGQHDTYLCVRGADDVVNAVRRCWASLWTARATAYRERKGFDHSTVQIAVVVQQMVDSEVSGVMFTANPMTAALDEIVINAAWGLGEGLVSGSLTPDLFVLQRDDLRVTSSVIGSKALKFVRDAGGPHGVVHQDVPEIDQVRPCLSDEQLAAVGDCGRRVSDYYGSPQDIEWAIADGRLYVLQSRAVTGLELV